MSTMCFGYILLNELQCELLCFGYIRNQQRITNIHQTIPVDINQIIIGFIYMLFSWKLRTDDDCSKYKQILNGLDTCIVYKTNKKYEIMLIDNVITSSIYSSVYWEIEATFDIQADYRLFIGFVKTPISTSVPDFYKYLGSNSNQCGLWITGAGHKVWSSVVSTINAYGLRGGHGTETSHIFTSGDRFGIRFDFKKCQATFHHNDNFSYQFLSANELPISIIPAVACYSKTTIKCTKFECEPN
eukprot:166679_1